MTDQCGPLVDPCPQSESHGRVNEEEQGQDFMGGNVPLPFSRISLPYPRGSSKHVSQNVI